LARPATAVCVAALALALAACGGSRSPRTGTSTQADSTAAGLPRLPARKPPRRTSADHLRDLIVRRMAEEFRAGTGAGPEGYATCVRNGFRRKLTRERMRDLLAVHRRDDGGPFAAQALTRMAGSVGRACGGARYLPEMIKASDALAGVRISEPLASRLGISYGPYLGLTCRVAASTRCDSIGIDLVLKHRARGVEATVGGRRLSLRTPGLNTGVPGRDWVGFIHHVGLERAGSPFRIPRKPGKHRVWAGSPPVYLPVRLLIEYPRERRAAQVPHVFLSPGWG
jgi:hypothetical protein